jgi:hypothetical protein
MLHKKSHRSMTTDRPSGHLYGVMKGHKRFFSKEDDRTLRAIKASSPEITWREVSERMRGFTARQLRERWCNYVSPDLNVNAWTPEEDQTLLALHRELGPCWGIIGTRMGNRSAPDIKNRFQALRRGTRWRQKRPRAEATEKKPGLKIIAVSPAEIEMPPLIVRQRAPPPRPDSAKEQRETPPTDFSIRSFLT